MSLNRREFLEMLAAGAAAGMSLNACASDKDGAKFIVDKTTVMKRGDGFSLLHITDCHAQLQPIYFREPSVNLGVGSAEGRAPHLVGDALAKEFGLAKASRELHAFTHLDFVESAKRFGKVGGFSHIATLVKQLKETRPGALLLDGGDTWQGSATSLWTNGQDMVDAAQLLGVEIMTGHWEFTLGAARVEEIIKKDFAGKIEFLAQNINTADFGDPVFKPFVVRDINGVKVAIIGQAFPYTPIANPAYMVPDWSFGIKEQEMQKQIDAARGQGAQSVVLLSHNGMDTDLKIASRLTGLDAILGGHTHDGVPRGIWVNNPSGKTLVTNAGSNGKFVGVLDIKVSSKNVTDIHYTLMPVFSDLYKPDTAMQALINKGREPYLAKLQKKLSVSEGLLYRRGNFSGSIDQMIVDALMKVKDCEIAFSPGFRWGTTILPGETITLEHVMDQTAITYPAVSVNQLSGLQIKTILEDVADNLFNQDPYYQQGGDMVRVGGLTYACAPKAAMGDRIREIQVGGKAISNEKTYKVAGWASVSKEAKERGGEPIWDVVTQYLKSSKTLAPPKVFQPQLIGVESNAGIGA